MFYRFYFIIVASCICVLGFNFPRRSNTPKTILSSTYYDRLVETNDLLPCGNIELNGRIVVSGIGQDSQDEQILTLLSNQGRWDSITLASNDSKNIKKRFVSRTAKYSGLSDLLEYVETNITSPLEFESLLSNATAWLAFNVEKSSISPMSNAALKAGVQRVVFTVRLDEEDCKTTSNIPEFADAIVQFANAGRKFTGIWHGTVVPGDDSLPYEIIRAGSTLPLTSVPHGVLGRVAVELLGLNTSVNEQCGVCLSNKFARDYLAVVRQRGMSRQEEVYEVFSGAICRCKDEYRNTPNRSESRSLLKHEIETTENGTEGNEEEEFYHHQRQRLLSKARGTDFDEELENLLDPRKSVLEQNTYVESRMKEILDDVMDHYQFRLLWKKLDKASFLSRNVEKARELATKEFRDLRDKKISDLLQRKAIMSTRDDTVSMQERQLQLLLSLERKELLEEHRTASHSIKYFYILLELLDAACSEKNISILNLNEFHQTQLLREIANALRRVCQLPRQETIIDQLDAAHIVETFMEDEHSIQLYGLDKSVEEIVDMINQKYRLLLKKVPALKAVQRSIDSAIKILQCELLPSTLSIEELRSKKQRNHRRRFLSDQAKTKSFGSFS